MFDGFGAAHLLSLMCIYTRCGWPIKKDVLWEYLRGVHTHWAHHIQHNRQQEHTFTHLFEWHIVHTQSVNLSANVGHISVCLLPIVPP